VAASGKGFGTSNIGRQLMRSRSNGGPREGFFLPQLFVRLFDVGQRGRLGETEKLVVLFRARTVRIEEAHAAASKDYSKGGGSVYKDNMSGCMKVLVLFSWISTSLLDPLVSTIE